MGTRDASIRSEFFEDWVKITCERDIHQFKKKKLDSELAFSILKATATLQEPTLANISGVCNANSKKTQSHLNALGELFSVHKLNPHPSGGGKAFFLPLDSGIAGYLGASTLRKLHIVLLNERIAHNHYFGEKGNLYYYYRSTGKHHIHLIEESLDGKISAFQLFEREAIKKSDLALLKAFKTKNPKAKIQLFAPISRSFKQEKVEISPWEELCL